MVYTYILYRFHMNLFIHGIRKLYSMHIMTFIVCKSQTIHIVLTTYSQTYGDLESHRGQTCVLEGLGQQYLGTWIQTGI